LNHKASASIQALIFLAISFLTSCGSSSATAPTIAIIATTGGGQNAVVSMAFGSALVAKVTSNGVGVSGVTVTFTAPAQTGASGRFAGGTNTATTNPSGVAISAVFTANVIAGGYMVTATAVGVSGTADFNLTNTAGAPARITATDGTPQNATVLKQFTNPLQATVVDSDSNPVSGVSVTFTAPASGASGTFLTSGTNTETDVTGTNGVAISSAFKADAIAGGPYTVAATAGALAPANFSLTNSAAPMIAAMGGTPQTVQINQPFGAQLQATVTQGGVGVSGVTVTFTAPASGAGGTFANNTDTETDITGANGVATSSTFKANATAGAYMVTATAAGVSGTADFNLTNTAVPTYAFYLSGMEAINDGPNFYAVAGSVAIDVNGNVLYGEQDYNDAFGITATDLILPRSAALTVDPSTGQGTLTLTTNDILLGPGGSGIETLGVQFVNNNHALIVQFDESATSSGSLDLQTAPSTPLPNNASYAFTLSGVDPYYYAVVAGGVFSISADGAALTGVVDVDDFGAETAPVLGTTFSGAAVSPPDSYGRGTITGTGIAGTLAYYIVGPEAIRIIDMDVNDSAFGSAFAQGTTTFTNTSLVGSVFGVQSNSFGFSFLGPFAAAGSFTIPAPGTFTGIGDDDEFGFVASGVTIGGNYAISNTVGATIYNGYGSLTFTSPLQDVTSLGIYMTDPNLNLNDPNNKSTGLGGALVADLDGYDLNGTGVLIPQTDTSPGDFTGSTSSYAFGAQDYFVCYGCEFDFVGWGSFSAGAFSGTGLLNDVFGIFGTGLPDTGVTFSGTPLPDTTPPESSTGRYTLYTPNPLVVSVTGSSEFFDGVIYQASGGQLFWLDEDEETLFLGPLEQKGSLTGVPGVRKGAAKSAKAKHK